MDTIMSDDVEKGISDLMFYGTDPQRHEGCVEVIIFLRNDLIPELVKLMKLQEKLDNS